jgi:membrane-associated phospholipid phosphatase
MPRRARALLIVALGCAAAGAFLYVALVRTEVGGRADAALLQWFANRDGPGIHGAAADLVRLLDPMPFAVWAAALVAVALARGRPRSALAVLGVLGGAAVTTQLLKPLLAAPRVHDTPAAAFLSDGTWPSGHTTGVTAIALCLVLVAPARLRRPAVAAAGLALFAVPAAILVTGAHYPSDVLGGYLVAAAWFAAGVAALWGSQATSTARTTAATRSS